MLVLMVGKFHSTEMMDAREANFISLNDKLKCYVEIFTESTEHVPAFRYDLENNERQYWMAPKSNICKDSFTTKNASKVPQIIEEYMSNVVSLLMSSESSSSVKSIQLLENITWNGYCYQAVLNLYQRQNISFDYIGNKVGMLCTKGKFRPHKM